MGSMARADNPTDMGTKITNGAADVDTDEVWAKDADARKVATIITDEGEAVEPMIAQDWASKSTMENTTSSMGTACIQV